MITPATAATTSSTRPASVSCSSSFPTPNSTPYTSRSTATQSIRLARPSADGRTSGARAATGPQPAREGRVRPSADGLANLIDWVAGCVLVYGVLFGVGKLLLQETLAGLILLVVAAVAGVIIYRDLSRRGWQTVVE